MNYSISCLFLNKPRNKQMLFLKLFSLLSEGILALSEHVALLVDLIALLLDCVIHLFKLLKTVELSIINDRLLVLD